MSEINDLRERVEAAEERFGLMDEQQRHYSERLIGLIETIEAQLADARGEIEKQIAENQRLGQENEELRTMLHSVLRSIEEKTFTQTLQNLESRVSALVSHAAAAAADSSPAPETDAEIDDEPQIDAIIEAEASGPGIAEGDAADPLIIEADAEAAVEPEIEAEPALEAAADDDGKSAEFDAGTDEAAIDQAEPDEAQSDEAQSEEALAVEALAADAEMPDSVAFEDADPAVIAAEAEAEAAEEQPGPLAEEIPDAETPTAGANEDDGQAAADMDGDAPGRAGNDDGEDIFAAMNLLNADDEDFAAAAQDVTPADDDMSVHEAAAAGSDFATPDAPEIEAETPVETAGEEAPGAARELSDAVAERLANEVSAEMAENVAPTVKEIIRRVGDLARELERAETARRNSHRDEHTAVSPEPAMTEDGGDAHPALDQAANA